MERVCETAFIFVYRKLAVNADEVNKLIYQLPLILTASLHVA